MQSAKERKRMTKREIHTEAMYLIKSNIENYRYDVAQGVAELAHGIGAITDKQYEKACEKIEKAKNNFGL